MDSEPRGPSDTLDLPLDVWASPPPDAAPPVPLDEVLPGPPPPPQPEVVGHLTSRERRDYQGISAREAFLNLQLDLTIKSVRDQHATALAPVMADFHEFRAELAARLGIPAEEIGTTHRIQADTWDILKLPPSA